MKVLQFLRETYCGDEHLVEEDSQLKRMKVIKSEAVGSSKAVLLNFVAAFSRIKHPGIIVPESFDLRDNPVIYFPHVNAEPIKNLDPSKKLEFVSFLLSLLRELLHHSIAIPVLSLDDFLFSDSFFMLPPFWFNHEQLPSGENIFVAPEFKEEGSFSVLSTSYVFGKLIEHICGEAEIKEFVKDFINEDPRKRRIHFSIPMHLFSEVFEAGRTLRLRPVLIKREEADQIVAEVLKEEVGLKTIFVQGPQRSGKTTILDFVSTELRRAGVPVIWARNLDTLFLGVVQLLSNEEYNRLDKIDQNFVEDFMVGKQLSLDQINLVLGKILNRIPKSLIVVDDVHEIEMSLRFALTQLQSFKFQSHHVLIASSNENNIPLRYDLVLHLKPLEYSKTEELISTMLDVPPSEVVTVSQWAYTVSKGLPGRIVQVISAAIKAGALRYIEDKLIFDPSSFTLPEFEMIIEHDLNLEKYKKNFLNLVALCGEKFDVEDFETLLEALKEKNLKSDVILMDLMNDGILYWENGRYRFTFKEIWQRLYETIDDETKENYHTYLAKKLRDPAKRAWHLLMLGRKVSAASLFLLAARSELKACNEISKALTYLEEAEKLFPARESYALINLKLQAFLIKQDANMLERLALILEGNQKYIFERYVALVAANKINLAYEIEEKYPSIFEAKTDFARLRKLCWRIRRMISSGEEVSEELVKEISILLDKLSKHRLHIRLKVQAMLLIALIRQAAHRTQALEILNKIKKISEKYNFLDLLPSILNTLAVELTVSQESSRLYEKMIEIGHKIGSIGTIQRALSNVVWLSLYRGEIERMFINISRLRQMASLTGRLDLEAYSYFVEGNYHTYNHELESAIDDFSRELAIEKYLGIEQRALRGLVTAYAINGRIDEAVKLIKENIDNAAMRNPNFVQFRDLFLAQSDEEFLNAWKAFLYSEKLYWREETCQIFGPRLIRIDREGFSKFFDQSQLNNIRNGVYISLAQIYEGAALAYQAIGETPIAMNYAERAISIYKTKNLENAAKWLEKKLNLNTPILQAISIIDTAKESVDQKVAALLNHVKSLIQQITSFQSLAQYALDTLKAISAQDQLLPTLEFLASRIMGLLPLSSVAMIVKDVKGRIVEKVSFDVPHLPDHSVFSYSPLEVCSIIPIYEGYSLILYGANSSLHLDETTGIDLLRMMISMQEVAAHIIKNILIYQQSITDPLTGLYNRRYFTMKLEEEFERVNRYGGHFSVILADIDDFKKINDKYGHDVGDEVLKFISSVLRSSVRSADILGRYGGEEFLLILPNTPKQSAIVVAKKILESIIDMNPFAFRLTLSFGVSGYPEDPAKKPEDIIVFADKAMYVSKERGKACVTAYQQKIPTDNG